MPLRNDGPSCNDGAWREVKRPVSGLSPAATYGMTRGGGRGADFLRFFLGGALACASNDDSIALKSDMSGAWLESCPLGGWRSCSSSTLWSLSASLSMSLESCRQGTQTQEGIGVNDKQGRGKNSPPPSRLSSQYASFVPHAVLLLHYLPTVTTITPSTTRYTLNNNSSAFSAGLPP